MLKTVIFDLDGTLLNTIGDLAGAGNHVCAQRGWPSHTEAEFRRMVGYGIPNLVEKFTPEECRDEATLAAALAEFQRYYGAHQRDRTAPYDGVPAMLAALKDRGLRLAVYSNKADEFSRSLAEYFFPGTFDAILGKRPGIPGKPDPAGLRLLLAELGTAPEESVNSPSPSGRPESSEPVYVPSSTRPKSAARQGTFSPWPSRRRSAVSVPSKRQPAPCTVPV